MARVIKRFRFFPLLGEAGRLRQPIHVRDVAGACLAALKSSGAINRAYNLSGGETLTYKAMVKRIFQALGQRMNRDLVFDHAAASTDFGFQPQPFVLSAEDLPK